MRFEKCTLCHRPIQPMFGVGDSYYCEDCKFAWRGKTIFWSTQEDPRNFETTPKKLGET